MAGHPLFMGNSSADSWGMDPTEAVTWAALVAQIPMAEDTLDARADIAAVARAERGRVRLRDRLSAVQGPALVIGVKAHGVGELTRVQGRFHSVHDAGVLVERAGHEYELCIVFWPAIAWMRNVPWALRDENVPMQHHERRISCRWSHLLRAAEHRPVRVLTCDGQSLRGRAHLCADFISIQDEHGVEWTVPLGTALQIEFQRVTE